MKNKLLPCPFCGDTEGIECRNGNLGWYVGCWNIHCMFQPGESFDSKSIAIKTWNTRLGKYPNKK